MVMASHGASEGGWSSPECDGCIDRDLQIASMDLEVQLLHSHLRRLRLRMADVVRTIANELLEG